MVQIAFLTLFLGLTSGSQPVAVEVRGPVAAVELVLDGAAVVRMSGPPWRTRLDFGPSLEPHELVARALDDKGQEVGRARQILNLPRPHAEVEMLLDNGPQSSQGMQGSQGSEGTPAAVRLTWHHVTGEKPAAVSLYLDGQPVALKDLQATEARAALPAYDPDVSHILSAEVRFSAAVTARKDIGFGGRLGDQVSTELTAVPVRLRPGKALPAAADLQGWVLVDGKPVAVTAAEEGTAQLLVVRDNEARQALERFDWDRAGRGLQAGVLERRRYQMLLGKEDLIRFTWPSPRAYPGTSLPAEVFDTTRDYTGKEGGLLWLLGSALPASERPDQRISDAVAVAGLQGIAGNRPRAVLLVLSHNPKDSSQYDAGRVRHYLASVRVPLAVWTFDRSSPAANAWGEAADISSLPKLKDAFQKLKDDLAAQRILWIEGSHLPGAIALAPAASEVLELVR